MDRKNRRELKKDKTKKTEHKTQQVLNMKKNQTERGTTTKTEI